MKSGHWHLWFGIFGAGFAAMALQYLWIRQLGTALGLEVHAVAGVTAAWLGGLALGALLCRHPGFGFAALQAIAGIWGLLSWFLFTFLGDFLIAATGGVAGLWGTSLWVYLLLLPSTLAMGATLPAAERVGRMRMERCAGWIYGLHAAGSMSGVLAGAFLLVPGLGVSVSQWMVSGLLLGIAIACRRQEGKAAPELRIARRRSSPAGPITAFLLGFLGILWQMGCIRVLSQVLENSVYTFACLLAVYLGGSSVGALAYQRVKRGDAFFRCGPILAGVLVLAGLHAMASSHAVHDSLWKGSGGSPLTLFLLETGLAVWVILPAVLVMGGLLAHVLQEEISRRGSMGTTLFWNLSGAALAPLCFLTLLPLSGIRHVLILTALAYCLPLLPRCWKHAVAGTGLLIPLSLLSPDTNRLLGMQEGRLIEGPASTVCVTSEDGRERMLQVNRRFVMGGTAAAREERMQALLPLALVPGESRVLVLGVGTGITLGAVEEAGTADIVAAEILPEVIDALPEFAPRNRYPWPRERVSLRCMDARRLVREGGQDFDLILADVFHPARDGAGLLYTREHFRAVGDRLADGGLFCQWLPLNQLDRGTLQSVMHTFLSVFPRASAWWLGEEHLLRPVLALMGSREDVEWPADPVWEDPRMGRVFREAGLDSPLRLASHCLADRETMERFASEGVLNTDDNQFLVYRAPWIRSGNPFLAPSLLRQLLMIQVESDLLPQRFLWDGQAVPSDLVPRLRSRQPYLIGLTHEIGGGTTAARDFHLQSLAIDPSFDSAYARCISFVPHLAPSQAREMLTSLLRIRPGEPLARGLLERLAP